MKGLIGGSFRLFVNNKFNMSSILRFYVLKFNCNARLDKIRLYSKRATQQQIVSNEIRDGFPAKLFNKKYKTPDSMYIASTKLAKSVAEHVKPFLDQLPPQCTTAVEFNPGIGLLTREILNEKRFKKLFLFEPVEHFHNSLRILAGEYPGRIKLRSADFANIWKLAFQDKVDNGQRVPELINDIPRLPNPNDTNCVLFGSVGTYAFFKHIINSIIFQHSFLMSGRWEMFLLVPPPIYLHLTCSSEIGYMIYRSTTILFQILFDYKFITQMPRDQLLPPQFEYRSTKGSKLNRIKSVNPDYLYLVKITPRQNLYDLCPAHDLPALWYFIKQNCISRRHRIIPNLEKYIPGCGPRLIVNNEEPIPTEPLYPDEDPQRLPEWSKRCTTMSNRAGLKNINIYTQFGDLTPAQMLSLFTQFRRWPEYAESSFLASLENSMLKMEVAVDEESNDNIDAAEQDDAISDEYIKEERAAKKKAQKNKASPSS